MAGWAALGVGLSFMTSVASVIQDDRAWAPNARTTGPVGAAWLWTPREGWPAPLVAMERRTTWADFEERFWTRGNEKEWVTLASQQEYRAGWPLRAWRWRREWTPAGAWPETLLEVGRLKLERGFSGAVWAVGPSPRASVNHVLTFPLAPNGWRFAASVLVFGGLPWLVVHGGGAWVTWRRGRRGQCRTCGYPLGSLTACPECGPEGR